MISAVRWAQRSALAAFTAVALVGSLAASQAAAAPLAKPAWQVFSVVGPTNLYKTTGLQNEIQRIEVGSGTGSYTLTFEGKTTGTIECEATPGAVQTALEALSTIGSGNVSVTDGGPIIGCARFFVTFKGALADKVLPPMRPSSSEVEVAVTQPGRAGWGRLALYMVNEGGAPSSGPITVTVALPPGITTYETPERTPIGEGPGFGNQRPEWSCPKGAGQSVVTCTENQVAYPGFGPGAGGAEAVPLVIPLSVEAATPGTLHAEIVVTGGSTAPVTAYGPITISPTPASPGLEVMKSSVYEADGTPAMQAGAHPFAITTGFFVHTSLDESGKIMPTEEMKNIEVKLPVGFVGNPEAVPHCDSHGVLAQCLGHLESQIGVAGTVVRDLGDEPGPSAIFNLVPESKVPAEFGFSAFGVPIHLLASVRSDEDYGITVSAPDTVQELPVFGSIVTFWGKPNEAMHDEERCTVFFPEGSIGFGCGATKAPNTPFLTDPTDCLQQAGEQPSVVMEASFWQHTELFTPPLSWGIAPVYGCQRVPFQPSLRVIPTQHTAASPTGLLTELHMPQVDSEEGVAEADVKKAVVTLPEGMTISPAAAGGLSACSTSQIGLTSSSPLRFDKSAPSCPESSKLGTFTVDTPLLPNPLKGNIYLAEQDTNPFGTLLAMYLYAYDPVSGVEVKVAGHVDPDPVTGRITATFDDLPQLAFGDVKLSFKSGPRAPIETPTTCGTFTATSDLTPTSMAGTGPNGETIPGGGDALSTDSVTIEGCKPAPYAPSFVAGGANNQAAAFTPFTMTLSRNSDEEAMPRTISLTMPQGLSGVLSNVPLCGEPQASQGTCPSASQIGHVTVVFGDGPNPLTLPEAGKGQDPVYLTGPYKGAPFGLAIVVPAEAGPFNLGNVVVRAKVNVDPQTAQITVVSDPMPVILRGIPTDLRTVNVVIDRERFTINPTSCEPMRVAGQIVSAHGESAAVSNRFQVANCQGLEFKPSFAVSTTAKTSRGNGASLDVKLGYPAGSLGKATNIAKVKVELPRQLPSRLTTLQKACPDFTFDVNPAQCPAGSRVGTGTATTPLIPVPLTGPAYFVSHGGKEFPELVIVLQGYGVTVELNGETFISKAGITSSTFKTVPDVPVQSFELKLPQGPGSALAANGNLCNSKMAMPTTFTAQNGVTIKRSTPIGVIGCRPALRVLRRQSHGATASIVVKAPTAGTLTASGGDVATTTAAVDRSGRGSISVTLSKRGRTLLARHPHRRLKVRVKLLFTAPHGRRIVAWTTVLIG